MGDLEQRRIIRRATWAAMGVGAILGPGVDAAPLLGIWGIGYIAILRDANMEVDEDQVRAALAALFAGAAQWVISGFVAKAVVALAASAALAATGVGILGVPVAILGTNAIINALYTYKFLSTTSAVVQDRTKIRGAIMEHTASLFISEVVNVSGLLTAIAGMIEIMFVG